MLSGILLFSIKRNKNDKMTHMVRRNDVLYYNMLGYMG